jgi:hypothetical protein
LKLSRVLAASAGVALVGASTLAFVAPASAADIVAPAAPFPAEASPYAAAWFTGGGSVGTSSSDPQFGLNIAAGPLVTDTYQVLNGTAVTGDLSDLANDASMYVTRGSATFQIPVFGEPGETNQQFTTLRPAVASTPGDAGFAFDAQWVTSQALPGFAAGSSATLPEFEAVLAGGVAGYQILGFGAAVGNGVSGSISSITFAGNTHLFRASAVGTYIPDTITVSELASTGISIDVSGFVPGEPVYIGLGTDQTGGPFNDLDYAADANGNLVTTITTTGFEPGDYTLYISGGFSGDVLSGDLTITADPAAVPAPAAVAPPVLAATGTDLSGGILAGGVLLLAGAGLALVATRRRFGSQA